MPHDHPVSLASNHTGAKQALLDSAQPNTDDHAKNHAAFPEPGTLALLCIGLASLGFAWRKKAA